MRCRYDIFSSSVLLLREAVEQSVAAGRDEVGLAATARHMGCVPGHRILRLGRISFPINVAKHGAAERAAGPVVAGQIHIAWESAALHVGARHHVVHVWTIAPHLDRLPPLL